METTCANLQRRIWVADTHENGFKPAAPRKENTKSVCYAHVPLPALMLAGQHAA